VLDEAIGVVEHDRAFDRIDTDRAEATSVDLIAGVVVL
jgi:hypothetical protein